MLSNFRLHMCTFKHSTTVYFPIFSALFEQLAPVRSLVSKCIALKRMWIAVS